MQFSETGLRPILTATEEAALGRRIQAGGPDAIEARNELALRNERLAYRLATKMANPLHPDFDDAFQEAMIGVMSAAEKFDPSKGWKFCTYARWYIRRNVYRTISKATAVRIPRREWTKSPKRVENFGDDIYGFPGTSLTPLEADIRAEEAAAKAASVRDCFDVLDDEEWQVISKFFDLDGEKHVRVLTPNTRALYESGLAKLRAEYLRRQAG